MFLKNFYLKNTPIFEIVNEKKFCSKNVYGKFLIRSTILKDKNLLFLDNNENFFHIKEKIVYSRLNFSLKKNILGQSFRIKNSFYTNQQNKLIKLNYFSFYKSKSKPLVKLQNFFYYLKKKKRISLLFIQAIKGGFLCYFSGVFCFIAHYQVYNYLQSKIKTSYKIKNFLKNLKYFFNLNSNFLYYPWFLSRFKLQINYTKKKKLKIPTRKFYVLQFNMLASKTLKNFFFKKKNFFRNHFVKKKDIKKKV